MDPTSSSRYNPTTYITISSSLVMAEGRGSAVKIAALLVVLCLMLNCKAAESATYIVGGSSGWTLPYTVSWSNGKRFKAGDVLGEVTDLFHVLIRKTRTMNLNFFGFFLFSVFNYSPGAHNVVAVSSAGYNKCYAGPGSKSYTSGKDQIALKKGTNYFICSFAGHCQAGMKIAVSAA